MPPGYLTPKISFWMRTEFDDDWLNKCWYEGGVQLYED